MFPTTHQINHILFDEDARRQFLTGFHKRKQARAEAAKKKAHEKERQERLQARRERRRLLREQAQENAAQLERTYGGIIGEHEDEDEWRGIDEPDIKGCEKDVEYEGEEQLATVTVVEEFDISSLRPDISKRQSETPGDGSYANDKLESSSKGGTTRREKSAVKPKKIRYETKAARKHEERKQHARSKERAGRKKKRG
ncbi:hypothetical protein AMATHDRAFT_60242 [Amanita thiersii Skay4041]|uniref:Ribosomal RNA-processing protein 17 n=1 Tax=Amanita thiersii Skay4041 TaxID=703135 RepID=A0A2A9NLF2_9AGAR|nr:hypothetical protein AMATHDRAFT_60242 [Amanita thiersii Skay4041]